MMRIPYRKRSHDEIRADVAAAQAGSAEARDRVIRHMLRLVMRHAHAYAMRINRMDLLDDMIQAATIGDEAEKRSGGLMRAIDTFDPKHGTAFTTHARSWIILELRKFLSRQGMLGYYTIGRRRRIVRVRDELAAELGEEPTHAQIMAEWEKRGYPPQRCTPYTIEQALGNMGRYVSYDALTDPKEDDGAQRIERSPSVEADPRAMSESDVVDYLDSRLDVQRALAALTTRERITVMALAGIGQPAMTNIELAKSRGVSRQRVNLIYWQALKKMRKALGVTLPDGDSA